MLFIILKKSNIILYTNRGLCDMFGENRSFPRLIYAGGQKYLYEYVTMALLKFEVIDFILSLDPETFNFY